MQSQLIQEEMSRMEQGKPLPPMDTVRYQLEPPAGTKRSDPAEWSKAVKNAEAQLQHQNTRLVNLELLQKYGSNAWRLHNFQLEAMLKTMQKQLEAVQAQITELSRIRKLEQVYQYRCHS